MNKVHVLGLSITVIFASLLISGSTNAYAGAPVLPCVSELGYDAELDIASGEVLENPTEASAKITVCPTGISETGAKGTGILTESGTLAVTTTHGVGVHDSELQTDGFDEVAHNHYANLMAPSQNCLDTDVNGAAAVFEVQSLSWESPGVAMWQMDMYKIWEVPKEFDGHFADVGVGVLGSQGAPQTFTLGPIGANPQVVSFSLAVGAGNEVCVLVQEIADATLEDLKKVGGLPMVIDSNALVLAGIQSSAIWMLPVLAGAAGAGAFFIRSRMNKD